MAINVYKQPSFKPLKTKSVENGSVVNGPNGSLALRMGGKTVAVLDKDNNLLELPLDVSPETSSDEGEEK